MSTTAESDTSVPVHVVQVYRLSGPTDSNPLWSDRYLSVSSHKGIGLPMSNAINSVRLT